MRWDEIREMRCSIARTLSVVGDRWTLLIVRDAFLGLRRFEDFQRDLGLTRHLLADRLRKLEDEGIVERVVYQHKPVRHEYHLTAKGVDLYPVLISLVRWGDTWMDDEHGPPVVYEHKGCGHVGTPSLHCTECREPVSAHDIRAHLQPQTSHERSGRVEADAPATAPSPTGEDQ